MMTEYTTSSQAIREYMSAHDRTAYWVEIHSPEEKQYLSPSAPPSELDDWTPSSPISDAGSSHSLHHGCAPIPAPSRPRTPSRHAPAPPAPQASQVTFAQQWDPRTGRPMNHTMQYSPQMYHYPPQRGPNGMMYSHSAPVYSSQHPQNGYAPPMEASSSHHARSDHADKDRGSRSRHGSHKGRNRSRSNSGAGGLHRSHPPLHLKLQEAFFQRLFGFAKFSSAGSTKGSTHGGRKLHRRHSTGNSSRLE
ncbi:hypothetical protein BDQ17DRAFT_1342122 [Cyathus striatus]|nr:hypothetical protein BDQ17DRAFT_1342122 [Cyathus striatus]